MPKQFVDTNNLLYANDHREPAKRLQAARLLAELAVSGTAVVSSQVLLEFAAVSMRKLNKPPEVVSAQLARLHVLELVAVDVAICRRAVELHVQHQIAVWDAAILAAAERAGCDILYTEDLNHGQVYGTVRVNNPFA